MRNNGFWQFEGFRLDTAAGLLTHSGEPVKLAPKVYQSLVYLVENRDHVVSKDEIFSAVWSDTFVEDNALSYTISQLRKALAQFEPDKKFIETVPRRGFRFVGDVLFVENESIERISGSAVAIDETVVEEMWIEEVETDPHRDRRLALPARAPNPNRWFAVSLIAGLVLLSAAAVWITQRESPPGRPRTVAVLPLEDLSGSGIDRSVILGMTYGLIAQLGRSDDLAVRPLNSTLAAGEKQSDPLEIGKALGVDSIVEWNLQRSGDQYRVNARLLQISDGRQLWNESFVYNESDLFQVQDTVTTFTARSLIANLSNVEQDRLHARITENNEAYHAYLRGRFHWNRRNLEGFNTALGLFEQAISLDPKFAEAHAGIADVYLGLYDYGYKPAGDSIPFAMAAVNRALQLDPQLADAYSTLASIEFLYNRNWQATEANFRRAIELAPNDPTPRLRFGWMLSVAGRTDEGLKHLKIAEQLDPTSQIGQANIAYNLMVSGRLKEAEEKLIAVSKASVDFSLVYWYLGTVYFLEGRESETLEQYFIAYQIDEGNDRQVAKIRGLMDSAGREIALRTWREDIEKRYASSYFPPSNIALIAALGRDRANTIKWLQEADRVRDPWLLQILHDPEYGFLKGDPDFEALTAKLKMEGR